MTALFHRLAWIVRGLATLAIILAAVTRSMADMIGLLAMLVLFEVFVAAEERS